MTPVYVAFDTEEPSCIIGVFKTRRAARRAVLATDQDDIERNHLDDFIEEFKLKG